MLEEKLLNYGFKKEKNKLVYTKNLNINNFYVKIIYENEKFIPKVYDILTEDEYLPFYNISSGSFTTKIKEEVEEIINIIKEECLEKVKNNFSEEIINYIKEKYNVYPEYPWDKFNTYFTLKTIENNKWFLLYMTLNSKKLGLDDNNEIEVINLKISTEKIKLLVDNVNIFPAYHMNKKYWITVKIDGTLSMENIKNLIDESYTEVIKKKKLKGK